MKCMCQACGRGRSSTLWQWRSNAKRITADRGKEFLEQLARLNFKMDRGVPVAAFPRLHSLAAKHQLTAYDVAYLDQAARLSLPLASRDDDLKAAAIAEGIEVLPG